VSAQVRVIIGCCLSSALGPLAFSFSFLLLVFFVLVLLLLERMAVEFWLDDLVLIPVLASLLGGRD
jgi:hypothetical protein